MRKMALTLGLSAALLGIVIALALVSLWVTRAATGGLGAAVAASAIISLVMVLTSPFQRFSGRSPREVPHMRLESSMASLQPARIAAVSSG